MEKKKKRINCLVLIEKGEIIYTLPGGECFSAQPGDLVYLPQESAYRSEIVGQPFCLARAEFRITDSVTGEPLRFADRPRILLRHAEDLSTLFSALAADGSDCDPFARLKLLAELLQQVRERCDSEGDVKIAPALSFMRLHYAEKFSVAQLAKLCSCSEPQLFRLFRREIGMTPMDFRDALRFRKAEEMLLSEKYVIAEIADALGFESVYYFSRFFKNYAGVAPTKYISG